MRNNQAPWGRNQILAVETKGERDWIGCQEATPPALLV
jgi:hypothetical protein